MTSDETREALADYAHKAWAGWMRHMFDRCTKQGISVVDRSLLIHSDDVERWQRQMETPYADLSEQEKDSDRKEADKMLMIIESMDYCAKTSGGE